MFVRKIIKTRTPEQLWYVSGDTYQHIGYFENINKQLLLKVCNTLGASYFEIDLTEAAFKEMMQVEGRSLER